MKSTPRSRVPQDSGSRGAADQCEQTVSCQTRPRFSSQRRGTIAVVALLVLGVMAALIAEHARRVLMERRQLKHILVERQTDKLASAGVLLARMSVRDDPAWAGTVWDIPAGAIHQTNSGEVTIQIQNDECTVVARYPVNSSQPVRITKVRKLKP